MGLTRDPEARGGEYKNDETLSFALTDARIRTEEGKPNIYKTFETLNFNVVEENNSVLKRIFDII